MSDAIPKVLTKSNFMLFQESPRLFWDTLNDPAGLPPENPFDKALMEQGLKVDLLARDLYPGAKNCQPPEADFMTALAITQSAIDEASESGIPRVLLQASFLRDGVYSRTDVLRPDERGGYELLEVKAVSSPGPEHYTDVAFQLHALRKAGVPVSAAKIVHLNSEYRRSGPLDLKQLFTETDATAKAEAAQVDLPGMVVLAQDVMNQPNAPVVDIGDGSMLKMSKEHCAHYAPDVMTNDSVLYFPGIHRKKALEIAREIRAEKVAAGSDDMSVRVSNVPDDSRSLKHTVFRQCAIKKQMYVDQDALKSMLESIQLPATFLDFETILGAIPAYDGAKPNSQVPFQVCALRIDDPKQPMRVFEHLADHEAADPRRGVLQCVADSVDGAASVVAFNSPFELTCLRNMMELARDMNIEQPIAEIESKMLDIGKPFMGYQVYSHEQNGSGGLKPVSKALFEGDPYKDQDVQGGSQASFLFAELTAGNIPESQVADIRAGLVAYCTQDVQGMIDVAGAMEEIAGLPDEERRFTPFMKSPIKQLPEMVNSLDTVVLQGRSKSSGKSAARETITY